MRSKKTTKSKSFQAGTLGGSMMAFLCDVSPDLFFLLTFVYSFFGRGIACLDNYFLWIVDAFFFFFLETFRQLL